MATHSKISEEMLPHIEHMSQFKDIPTRHAITGCFLYMFWENENKNMELT